MHNLLNSSEYEQQKGVIEKPLTVKQKQKGALYNSLFYSEQHLFHLVTFVMCVWLISVYCYIYNIPFVWELKMAFVGSFQFYPQTAVHWRETIVWATNKIQITQRALWEKILWSTSMEGLSCNALGTVSFSTEQFSSSMKICYCIAKYYKLKFYISPKQKPIFPIRNKMLQSPSQQNFSY